jgi:hypothetical protein
MIEAVLAIAVKQCVALLGATRGAARMRRTLELLRTKRTYGCEQLFQPGEFHGSRSAF